MDDWSVSDTARAAASGQAPNPTKPLTLTQTRFFMDDFHLSEGGAAVNLFVLDVTSGGAALVGGGCSYLSGRFRSLRTPCGWSCPGFSIP